MTTPADHLTKLAAALLDAAVTMQGHARSDLDDLTEEQVSDLESGVWRITTGLTDLDGWLTWRPEGCSLIEYVGERNW